MQSTVNSTLKLHEINCIFTQKASSKISKRKKPNDALRIETRALIQRITLYVMSLPLHHGSIRVKTVPGLRESSAHLIPRRPTNCYRKLF